MHVTTKFKLPRKFYGTKSTPHTRRREPGSYACTAMQPTHVASKHVAEVILVSEGCAHKKNNSVPHTS